ncbi:GNAT family N-acetyltransferase [Curtobacterium luteum]|uniref:GNAT family N-acetyltransferase n=1 Tax=Curtobacterium luteum TaxID=33881 RepID=UPI003808B191
MIGSSFVVRAASEDEAAACVDLWVAAVSVRDAVPESDAVRARALAKFAEPRVALVVAADPGERRDAVAGDPGDASDAVAGDARVAGFALVTAPGTGGPGDPEDAAYLSLLAVDPRTQGLGLGRDLLRAAVDAASRAGHARCVLHALEDNAPALGLYRSAGFRPWGEPFAHPLSGRPTRAWVASGDRPGPECDAVTRGSAPSRGPGAHRPGSATGPTSPAVP